MFFPCCNEMRNETNAFSIVSNFLSPLPAVVLSNQIQLVSKLITKSVVFSHMAGWSMYEPWTINSLEREKEKWWEICSRDECDLMFIPRNHGTPQNGGQVTCFIIYWISAIYPLSGYKIYRENFSWVAETIGDHKEKWWHAFQDVTWFVIKHSTCLPFYAMLASIGRNECTDT